MDHSKVKAAQRAAVKNFKPITRTITIHECLPCYGSQPEGGESAWAQGCPDCEVRGECSRVTAECYDAGLNTEERAAKAARISRFKRQA